MKITNASRHFATTTTFHGLNELFLTTNKFMKVIWAIIMLLSIVLCAWQLYQTITEFQSQPTSMRTFTKQLDMFPTVYFTVLNTIDYNRLQQYGLDSPHGWYILDHFPALEVQAEGWKEIASDPKKIEKIRADIQRVQEENGWDFEGLVRAVANSPESLFTPRGKINMSVTINEFGINYAFNGGTELGEHGVGYSMGIDVKRQAVKGQLDSSRLAFRDYRGVYLSVGSEVHDAAQWYLVNWNIYNLIMAPQMTKSVSKKQRPCSNKYENALQCISVYKLKNQACGRDCKWFVGQKGNHSQRFCINAIDRCSKNISCMSDCKTMCPPSCSIWNYNVQQKQEIAQNPEYAEAAGVYIFMSSMEVMATEEYFSYSSNTLFCNVGGILSLYLGASVLSFMHLVYFWFFKARTETVDPEKA